MKRLSIEMDDAQVSTMQEVAETLNNLYKWTEYAVNDDSIDFRGYDPDLNRMVHGRLQMTGFVDNLDRCEDLNPVWQVDFGECFDWVNFIWVRQRNGKFAVLHN